MRALFVFLISIPLCLVASDSERNLLFNADWRFLKGPTEGAQQTDFDDSDWRSITLPHDWSVEDLPVDDTKDGQIISGPFDSTSEGGKHNGFFRGGTSWYRKHFNLPESAKGQRIYLHFDGVYMNSRVWINGNEVNHQPYGYSAFNLDITDQIHFGDLENTVAVEVRNEGDNSRWYTGSGINRNVHLSIVNPIHIQPWGVSVTTPKVSREASLVALELNIANLTDVQFQEVKVEVAILDATSKTIATKQITTSLHKDVVSQSKLSIPVESCELWSPDNPYVYRAVCRIRVNDKVVDETTTPFGIRNIEYDTEKGMFLNGKSIKLKGGAVHGDNGPLGTASFAAGERRRVQTLKDAGYNAIRCAHNPPSTEFLNACDAIGMLVIDEAFDTWVTPKRPDDYNKWFAKWWKHDAKTLILRDRNHPCVFTWSIGNQPRNARTKEGIELAHEIADYVRSLDPTRPVTANVFMRIGGNYFDGDPKLWQTHDSIFEALDLGGYSYESIQYENDHQRLPDRLQFSSEINSRDIFRNWMRAVDNEFVLGNFTWTAIDYIGESGAGWINAFRLPSKEVFPWHVSVTGDFDICGFKKPRSYYRDIIFGVNKKVAAFVKAPVSTFPNDSNSLWGWDDVKQSWTWPNQVGKTLEVHVYSSCDTVELKLNGKSQGKKQLSRETEFKSTWEVEYHPGILEAVGYVAGEAVDSWTLESTGTADSIRLSPDKSSLLSGEQDLCYVTVEVLDKHGRLVPDAEPMIEFEVIGSGSLAAVGNGNPLSLESFQLPQRKAFEGKALLVVRSGDQAGEIKVLAKSKDLRSHEIILKTEEQ